MTLSYRRGRGKAGRRLAPRIRGQKKCTRCRITRQPDKPGLPARWFDRSARGLLRSALPAPSPCRLSGASKAQLNRCVPTRPDAYGLGPHEVCSPPRPLPVGTNACSRVCSPSRLPRRRVTAPVVRRLSASIASCPAISDDSRVAPLTGQDGSFNTAIPNYDKAKYFCGRGLTDFWCFARQAPRATHSVSFPLRACAMWNDSYPFTDGVAIHSLVLRDACRQASEAMPFFGRLL